MCQAALEAETEKMSDLWAEHLLYGGEGAPGLPRPGQCYSDYMERPHNQSMSRCVHNLDRLTDKVPTTTWASRDLSASGLSSSGISVSLSRSTTFDILFETHRPMPWRFSVHPFEYGIAIISYSPSFNIRSVDCRVHCSFLAERVVVCAATPAAASRDITSVTATAASDIGSAFIRRCSHSHTRRASIRLHSGLPSALLVFQ